ncbi:asparagine synthase (glutamine-hydrolyzing) [Candidatus Sororendozoicomonas aggregata]|uniref:asparagine synthase (glutamine-hydrolyzing) n=1 Tax=Candidatus Sororendozoicomonas aggregata TaxID=3073239 RepID=UPI002ED2BD69
MCGIAGYFSLVHSLSKVNSTIREHLLEGIESRGPDSTYVSIEPNSAMLFSRLAITGNTNNSKQPFLFGKTKLVYNGEIYNFRKLSNDYLNIKPKSNDCDGAILLPLINRFGLLDALNIINGPFAIAYELPEQLILARDRLGKKPLYYTLQGDHLFYSSNISSLFTLMPSAKLNIDAINDYFVFKSVGATCSMVKGIYEVEPGGIVTVSRRGSGAKARIQKSFILPVPVMQRVDDVMIRQSLENAIEERVHDVQSYATLLSGGLDSSIINDYLSRTEKPFTSYTIGSDDGDSMDEIPLAQSFATSRNINHHCITLRPDNIIDLLEESIVVMEQPVQDPIIVNSLMLSKEISKNHRVLVTGDGADELWLGYARYRDFTMQGLKKYVESLSVFRTTELRNTNYGINTYFGTNVEGFGIEEIALHERKIRLKNYHLTRLDKIFMKNGLEVRSPFLDMHHVSICDRVSPDTKIQANFGKAPLRNAFRSQLGFEVSYRKKQPFTFQFHYFRNPDIFSYFIEPLLQNNSIVHDYVDASELRNKVINGSQLSTRNLHQIWSLKVFDLWYEMVYKGKKHG